MGVISLQATPFPVDERLEQLSPLRSVQGLVYLAFPWESSSLQLQSTIV